MGVLAVRDIESRASRFGKKCPMYFLARIADISSARGVEGEPSRDATNTREATMEHETERDATAAGGQDRARRGDYTIWIEAEEWGEGAWNPADEASDVIVTFADGRRWIASFVAYGHVATLVERNRESGENLGGRYLWASDLVLVDQVRRDSIEAVVADLMADGGFESAFTEER
jgi:hypothetical protein